MCDNRPIPLGHTLGHLFLGIVTGVGICVIIFFGYTLRKLVASTIDERATNLNYMQYNGKENRMVYREGPMKCDKWTFQYLKYGTMKDQTK